jgi:hypothetical protein
MNAHPARPATRFLVFAGDDTYRAAMRCVVLVLTSLTLACRDGAAPRTGPTSCPDATPGPRIAASAIDDPIANAAPGSGSVTITGPLARSVDGDAGGFEIGAASAIAIIDIVDRDAQGAPTSELLVFLRTPATERLDALVPVSVADLRTPGYDPPGSFAVYAEGYDPVAGDYTRWLVARVGCVRVTDVTPGLVGRVTGVVGIDGDWEREDGSALGSMGSLSASFSAPLLRIATPEHRVRDSLLATTTGAREDDDTTSTLDAFQILAEDQRRLVIVGTVPGDTIAEYWLSLAGVPAASTTSIPLSAVSIDDVLAGRASGSWAAVRLDTIEGIPLRVRELEMWRSTGGSVTLTNVVRTGPLALCGWATGRYEFPAAGTEMRTGGRGSLGTATVRGTFATVFTVLPPADTVERSTAATADRLVSSGSVVCPH